jgi:Protein of unknown function (DUF2735)
MKGETDMLNTDSSRGSAKIYQFPAGGRAALGGRRYGDAMTDPANAPRVNEALCSDSWYHQAAIEESKPVRDH